MIGYSGSGYKGMQIIPDQKTIEGDLFQAFIDARAISKANATDPKKSSLVRCARTDKGVHAAGNVISLKLIIEDEDIVQKVNAHLPEQIRIWGIERTTGSFSCYQACDSRWYEYLIPTHCFLPPHPSSYMAKRLEELAQESDDTDSYQARQGDARFWWEEAEEKYIKPVLDDLDEGVRVKVMQAMYRTESAEVEVVQETLEESEDEESDDEGNDEKTAIDETLETVEKEEKLETDLISKVELTEVPDNVERTMGLESVANSPIENGVIENSVQGSHGEDSSNTKTAAIEDAPTNANATVAAEDSITDADRLFRSRLDAATKRVKAAYIAAKQSYRLSPERLSQINATLEKYQGTFNFHNYTVRKSPNDPSAKRHIKSFVSQRSPSSKTETGTFEIGGTEWLSIKVHGQSFMMHQIRKMVGMAALVVRCGCTPDRITETLGRDVVVAVPKAPGLGLLLEHPVFDTYNEQRAAKFDRPPIGFAKYDKEMGEFKEREIYQRIYTEEEKDHVFHTFFSQIDNFKNPAFLYLSSKGFAAVPEGTRTVTKKPIAKSNRGPQGRFDKRKRSRSPSVPVDEGKEKTRAKNDEAEEKQEQAEGDLEINSSQGTTGVEGAKA